MSSASFRSASVVKPTRSRNRTDTKRRSVSGSVWSGVTGSGEAAIEISDVPHSPQNFTPVGFAVPHEAQVTLRAVPHSPQNLRPSSLGVPQASQVMVTDTGRDPTGANWLQVAPSFGPRLALRRQALGFEPRLISASLTVQIPNNHRPFRPYTT